MLSQNAAIPIPISNSASSAHHTEGAKAFLSGTGSGAVCIDRLCVSIMTSETYEFRTSRSARADLLSAVSSSIVPSRVNALTEVGLLWVQFKTVFGHSSTKKGLGGPSTMDADPDDSKHTNPERKNTRWVASLRPTAF